MKRREGGRDWQTWGTAIHYTHGQLIVKRTAPLFALPPRARYNRRNDRQVMFYASKRLLRKGRLLG